MNYCLCLFRYCYVCIGKAKGENLCFVCGNKSDNDLNRCENCGKLFHEDCLKNAKQQQRGKWLCVLCAANDTSSVSNGNSTASTTTPTKPVRYYYFSCFNNRRLKSNVVRVTR